MHPIFPWSMAVHWIGSGRTCLIWTNQCEIWYMNYMRRVARGMKLRRGQSVFKAVASNS